MARDDDRTLSEILGARGLSATDAAALLAEHGLKITVGPNKGAPITADSISRRMGRTPPRAWLPILDTSGDGAPGGPPDDDPSTPGEATSQTGRRSATPPRRPAEAKITLEDTRGARKRIAGAYKFCGAALAAGSGSQGVAEVWGDQADSIAELWVSAAEDSPWAARFVNMMQAGGSMGDLAASHLYLAGATLYVLGAGIPGGDTIFAKYSRHRPPPAPADPGHDPGQNGTAPVGAAAGAVGDDPVEPRT